MESDNSDGLDPRRGLNAVPTAKNWRATYCLTRLCFNVRHPQEVLEGFMGSIHLLRFTDQETGVGTIGASTKFGRRAFAFQVLAFKLDNWVPQQGSWDLAKSAFDPNLPTDGPPTGPPS